MFDDTDLSQVQAGDKVIYSRYGHNSRNRYTLEIVERATKTQIVVKGKRFNRANGTERNSSSWFKDDIYPATAKNVVDAQALMDATAREDRHRALIHKVSRFQWRNLSLEQLEQIAAILDK